MQIQTLRLGLLLVWAFVALAPGLAYGMDQDSERQLQVPTYLSVVIDLRTNGSFRLIKATRIDGEVILRDFQTSDFIYEVTSGEHTLAVAFFAEDPFLVRTLGDGSGSPESTSQAKSAVIVINIPLRGNPVAGIRKLRLRIFKLVPGTRVEELDSSVLQQLKAQKKLILITDLPPKTFGWSIRRKLTKLRH